LKQPCTLAWCLTGDLSIVVLKYLMKTALFGLIVFCLTVEVFSQNGTFQTSLTPYEKAIVLQAEAGKVTYALPDSFLIPDSESVRLDSLLLQSGKDYRLHFVSGKLKLLHPPSEAGLLRLSYKIFPFSLKQHYFHQQAVEEVHQVAAQSSTAAPSVSAKPTQLRQEFFPSRLRKSGSIIRGLSVGSNQGLQVNSGLRLQLSGKLTQNVEVVASLTDQNTPIQPEGNTQTLQEIDKVFIQLKGPHLRATLGDFTLNFPNREFTRYNRKLEGFMGQGEYQNLDFTVSGAVSRGQFTTNEFLGQEGNQGPYQLTGPNGEINILILAGTERVWIDGQEMRRGENNDYVIEYGNGQITFTRKRLITADSRIVVDFQFSDESFQRNYWAVQAETKLLHDKLKFGTTFLRESDDKDNPLTLTLADDFVNALRQAGDGQAVVPGWRFVGQDSGNYVMESDSVFRFVGSNKGDYNVIFSFFGANKGDYDNIGLGRFEFVGENQGSYRPLIILPKAARHDMFGLHLTAAPGSGLTLSSEVAFSQFDANTYSTRDDGDNGGAAYLVKLNFRPASLALGGLKLGEFSLTGKLRNKQANFRDIDRTTIAEFSRKWNIANANLSREESIQEIAGSYSPLKGVAFRGGFGHLSKAAVFDARRWEARSSLSLKALPRVNYFVEFIDRNDKLAAQKSTWLRQRGTAEYRYKFVKPLFEYEGEIKKDAAVDTSASGFRFDAYTGGLELRPGRAMLLSARYNVRDDKKRVGTAFRPASLARTQTYAWNLNNWRAMNISAAFTHRTRSFSDSSASDTRADLADIRVGFAPRRGALKANLNYQISNTQVASQEEVFIEVEEGQGNFRFNEARNEFEPDPFGNFVRRLFSTKNFIPVLELRFRGDIRFSFRRWFGKKQQSDAGSRLKKLLWPLSSETFFRIDERSRERDVARIFLLDLSRFQQDSTTLFGNIELRQDIYLWENSRRLSFRYRFRRRSELNNQFIGGGQERDLRQHRFRVLSRLSRRFTSQVELMHSSEDRLFESPTREDRRIRLVQADLDLVFRPKNRVELGLKAQFSRSKDLVPSPDTRANLYSLAPRTNYSWSNKGRFRAELQWTFVTTSPKSVLIPFELTNGNRSGTTLRWNVGFDYRMSQNVQTSFSYFGRSEPGRPRTQHIAKVEMRAFF